MLSLTGCRGGAGLDPRATQSISLGRLIRRGGITFLDDYQLRVVARARILLHHQPGLDAEGVSTPTRCTNGRFFAR